MEKVAFFVEGQTEQIFINRLAKEILGPQKTNIIQKKIKGGTRIPRQEIVRNLSMSRKPWYEILIYDCGSDNRVKSEMLDNMLNLKEQGYTKIVGLRDLYPMPIDELGRLQQGLRFMPARLKNRIDYFNVIIAIHEVEAWFLAETNHFQKIDRKLTGEYIEKKLGFNPQNCDPVEREHPAEDLNEIYRLIGRSYTKRYEPTRRVVNRLDYHNLRNNLSKKIQELGDLIQVLEELRVGSKKKRDEKRKN